jgi:hypothetical protein
MLNAALVEFAATVTDAGAVRVGAALLDNVTTDPLAGAAVDSVTAQFVLLFAAIVEEVQLNPEIVTGATAACNEIVAEAVLPFNAPVSVAVWLVEMVLVEILNVAELALAATVTEGGAVKADVALFVMLTTVPPTGAACDKVTVHDVPLFEEMLLDAQPRLVITGSTAGACSESVADAWVPFTHPVSVAL